MPLKHATETLMVFVLALAIAIAGAVSAFLPPVSVSILPWLVAFAISLVYPLVLYPHMKERRADYEFRALHFIPALILLIWLIIDLLVAFRPNLEMLQLIYTWGWSLAMVGVAFFLMLWFVLRVIRQRIPRILILIGVLVPFLAFSQLSGYFSWDRNLAMTLWDGILTGSGLIAKNGGSGSNLDPSLNKAEEHWRAQLRLMERRRIDLARNASSSSTAIIAAASTSSARVIAQNASSKSSAGSIPPKLPTSGSGVEGLVITMLAGFTGVVHRRTIKRRNMFT